MSVEFGIMHTSNMKILSQEHSEVLVTRSAGGETVFDWQAIERIAGDDSNSFWFMACALLAAREEGRRSH